MKSGCVLTDQSGLAVGAMSVNVPTYNAEVAPPEVRGGLVALQQLAIVAGIMVSCAIYNLSLRHGDEYDCILRQLLIVFGDGVGQLLD